MPISRPSKTAIIRQLIATKQKTHMLELELQFAGEFTEAKAASKKAKKLSREIDRLLGRAMDAWAGRGSTVVGKITDANAKLQRSIRSIQNGVKTAQNVVKALGLIDDVLVIAAKLAV